MKTLFIVIIALFITVLPTIAQEEEQEGFVDGGTTFTTNYIDHTTVTDSNEGINTYWKNIWYKKWSLLKKGNIEPLKESKRDNVVLVIEEGEELQPWTSFVDLGIGGLNVPILGIRLGKVVPRVIGSKKGTHVLGLAYSGNSDYILLSLQEDSIQVETVAKLLYDYVVSCKGEKGKALVFEKADAVTYINEALKDNTIRKKMQDEAVKRVNMVAPVVCIEYNPESGAALFAHSAINFIPHWKNVAISRYIERKSKGKYTLENIDQADAVFKAELRDSFLKELDKMTK